MKVLDLFSGIGGFSLGFEKAGFRTAAFCEIDPFCQKVLKRHWSDIPVYSDIKQLSVERLEHDGITDIDIITGGFPCTDLSVAGKQRGMDEGTRSGLWWEMRRLIGEIQPKFAVMENVPNFLSGDNGAWFGDFLASLAEIGYDAEWTCISAAAVGRAHLRERMWIVAYPDGLGFAPILEKINLSKSYIDGLNDKTDLYFDTFRRSYPAIPEHLRVDDELPTELDEIKNRVKACGNSIVPEIAFLIAQALRRKMEGDE
jgi:DNA (cytosine-5)-methyltransferase 1